MERKTWLQDFTGKYALSKTLRFELKPHEKTRNFMLAHEVLVRDEEIQASYQMLKPIMDQIHEDFIIESLEGSTAKDIAFSSFLQRDISEKEQEKIMKELRGKIGETYLDGAKKILEETKNISGYSDENEENNNDDTEERKKEKGLFKKKNHEILQEAGIMKYIEIHKNKFVTQQRSLEDIDKALKVFSGFFTYFSGFNQNRENYYETKEVKKTAIATRIVHENLPKFCDNILAFKKRSSEYLAIYDSLDKTKQIKDAETKKMIPIYPIDAKYFEISYFNSCLSQVQIDEYNRIIGHYNSLINLYNQQQTEKSKKLLGFKTLYKQIGCGKRSGFIFEIKDDAELKTILQKSLQAGEKLFAPRGSGDMSIDTVREFIDDLRSRTDWEGYYWNKPAFNTISNWYFSDWRSLGEKFRKTKDNPTGIWEKADAKKTEESGETVKIPDAISLKQIFNILDQESDWKNDFFRSRILEKKDWTDENKKIDPEKQQIFDSATCPSEVIIRLLCLDIEREIIAWEGEKQSILSLTEYHIEASKELIKTWLDRVVNINRMLKYFVVGESKIKNTEPINPTLAETLKVLIGEPKLNDGEEILWFTWYDAVRNYLTKKVGEDAKENKLKLNFQNSTLAGGWDVSKETSNTCVILKDASGKKYLAVMRKDQNMLFQKEIGKGKQKGQNPLYIESGDFQKMEYKLLPGPNKMLPKCLLPKSDRKKYGATDEILEIYDSGAFKKSEPNFDVVKTWKLIDFYKEALTKYEDWRVFEFIFHPTENYGDISQFYADVEKQGYKLDFSTIDFSILETFVKEGKLYLFEIKNQDSNDGKTENHKQNLHTMYWDAIFTDVINRPKLNGEAEIFYRSAVDPKSLKTRIDTNGKEIIENFRFAKEKFVFHVPITLNFCLKNEKINDTVKNTLDSQNTHFLGLDRGEKHLVYSCLVDHEGNMIEAKSFNEINGKNYHTLLDDREGDRQEARKNWQTIGNIAKLKEGYISQIVHEIVGQVTTDPTMIVMEDLNTGFKRGRQKIEKQIYQKFELALAKKLNFIVDKSAKMGEIGSVTRAIQLTPPVQNYQDIENQKQVGIMLYTRANYTSQTDPLTGWRKTIYLKSGSKEKIKEQIVEKFTDIRKEGQDYQFHYTQEIKTADDVVITKKDWILHTRDQNGKELERYRGKRSVDKNQWTVEKVPLTEMLDGLFVNFDLTRSILSQMLDEGVELTNITSEHTAWESLRYVIEMIQQIRNANGEKGTPSDNFLLSPVRDESGKHFDSRNASENLPQDADMNGAYNIARKGIIMQSHIEQWKVDGSKEKDLNLFVSDAEWDLWLNHKSDWRNNWLKKFSSKKAMESSKTNKRPNK